MGKSQSEANNGQAAIPTISARDLDAMAPKRCVLILCCILLLFPSACVLKKELGPGETGHAAGRHPIFKADKIIEKLTLENNRLAEKNARCIDELSKTAAEPPPPPATAQADCLAKVDKLNTRNRELEKIKESLTGKVSRLKLEIKKRDSIIELQENVIQLLDDTKKTIETSLKEQIAKKMFEIESTNGRVKMVLKDTLLFSPGSLEINPRGRRLLLKIAASVKSKKGQNIAVEGHTDNTPGKNYATNWDLSAARSIAVVRFLQDVAGIDPAKLSAVAYGSSRPIAENNTEEGRRQNRRIELIIHYESPAE